MTFSELCKALPPLAGTDHAERIVAELKADHPDWGWGEGQGFAANCAALRGYYAGLADAAEAFAARVEVQS